MPFFNPSDFCWSKVLSKMYKPPADNYTLFVPGVHHYISGGLVSHNCNPPLKTHWTYTDFVKEQKDRYSVFFLNPKDNLENIDDNFIQRLETLSEREKQRFLYGQWQDIAEGALFKYHWIEETRLREAPKVFDRIIISLDPAITSGEESDETGIIVIGLIDNQYYILDDRTQISSPATWADCIKSLEIIYNPDRIIIEANQGGEAWPIILQKSGCSTKTELMFASKSKLARAEPVASLYEKKLVHHIGNYSELEEEMVTYDGTGKSPNRLDALTTGIMFLEGKIKRMLNPHVGLMEEPVKKTDEILDEEWEQL